MLWLKGIAFGRQYDVSVFEPDVSPLAVQGPKSDDLMAELIGDQVRDIKFFWFIRASLADTDFFIARSGWSGQGGFELYLEDSSKGLDLWDAIWQAGEKYNIRAGCPNLIDRIERGLLSYGSDMTLENNPFECGLDRFFETTKEAEFMSRQAMQEIAEKGPCKSLAYLAIEGPALVSPRNTWVVRDQDNNDIGIVTSLAYSKKFSTNLAFATIHADANNHGQSLYVDLEGDEIRTAKVLNRFWA